MKKIFCVFASLMILTCSACKKTETPVTSNNIQESSQTSESSSNLQDEAAPVSDKLTYSNLDSEASVSEVRDILTKAGIQAKYVDTILDWVTDYNNCMKGCSSFSLVGDFATIDGNVVDYGEYYPMYTEWYRVNDRNYPDVLCRIAAFELIRNNVSVGRTIAKEAFDCWDGNTAWLYTDGDILFGREAEAYYPYPLIDWSEDMTADYFTLFDPIHISGECGEGEEFILMFDFILSDRGIACALFMI